MLILWRVIVAIGLMTPAPPFLSVIVRSEDDGGFYRVSLEGDFEGIPTPNATPTPIVSPIPDSLNGRSLFPPLRVADAPDDLFVMSGETTPFTDFYTLDSTGQPDQLTDVVALFPQAKPPILSASVEYLSARPGHDAFLFRARLLDSDQTTHNGLFLYSFDDHTLAPMPYFGKSPAWSPDGMALVGGRFDEQAALYILWIAVLSDTEESRIGPGCNPRWSADGAWIAYDSHESAQWQNYTDCFASGEVMAYHLEDERNITLTAALTDSVALWGWSDAD